MVLWTPIRPSRTNTEKNISFHHKGLECKRRKSRNTCSNRQVWPWSTEWIKAKANRVLSREHTGHSKHPFPAAQEMTLHLDITKWSIPKSDWLHSLQPKMEKLYTVSKSKTWSWLWLRSCTPYRVSLCLSLSLSVSLSVSLSLSLSIYIYIYIYIHCYLIISCYWFPLYFLYFTQDFWQTIYFLAFSLIAHSFLSIHLLHLEDMIAGSSGEINYILKISV